MTIFSRLLASAGALLPAFFVAFGSFSTTATAETGPLSRNGETGSSSSQKQAPKYRQLAKICFSWGTPVCAFKNGRWKTYKNSCSAKGFKATRIKSGKCKPTAACIGIPIRYVCGTNRYKRTNYKNTCYARIARATRVTAGRCPRVSKGKLCYVGKVRIHVSYRPSCGEQSARLRFRSLKLFHGRTYALNYHSGRIKKRARPHGICNFRTGATYICDNGRLRIHRLYLCQQGRSSKKGARCRITQGRR